MQRRDFVKLVFGAFTLAFILPKNALAAIWNKAAFETTQLNEAEKNLEVNGEKLSQDILITVPDKAENGAIVQVEVKSNILNTETISIFVEKNPTPLIAHFKFSNGAEPFVVTRIKMAETSDVKVVVKAGNEYFMNAKNVVVLENGCG
ncbi:MAG: thiosulfate oxidation carrier protein SoxY [Methylotenera sp.]|uniref:thiosulfate oxidation carrier protein SoxY n=1 Tax=Methylotenera sp. TaxID=2051956 RepID=UPI00248A1F31|nr:thiosulfate oxidation carrier protein SoxY [Methylotenera sp.]MDI1309222.1 thiosulfate oxidation carrier protein SoxY [Methylotenera sp.]